MPGRFYSARLFEYQSAASAVRSSSLVHRTGRVNAGVTVSDTVPNTSTRRSSSRPIVILQIRRDSPAVTAHRRRGAGPTFSDCSRSTHCTIVASPCLSAGWTAVRSRRPLQVAPRGVLARNAANAPVRPIAMGVRSAVSRTTAIGVVTAAIDRVASPGSLVTTRSLSAS